MATILLGNIKYVTYTAVLGDDEVSISPVKYANYRVCNIGTTGTNLTVKDSSTTSTIVVLEDDQMVDLVYDTAWRISNTSSTNSITGALTVTGTINTATITGGTWTAEKSGWLTQDISTSGTPDFTEIKVKSKLKVYYNSTDDSVIFAATDGVNTRDLIEFNASINVYDGGGADFMDYIDRTIDGGDANILSTYTDTIDGGTSTNDSEFWTYRLF